MKQEVDNTDIPWAWVKCVGDVVEKPDRQQMSKTTSLPTKLSSWLFLSDEKSIRDVSKLKRMGITHVLTVAGMPCYHERALSSVMEEAGILHKIIHGQDEEDYDMITKHWEECYNFLKSVVRKEEEENNEEEGGGSTTPPGRVVVHCMAGINRSSLIACAAHMIFERKLVIDVVENCVSCRGCAILTNRSFRIQLCLLAAKEELLGQKPLRYTDSPIKCKAVLPPPPSSALDKLCFSYNSVEDEPAQTHQPSKNPFLATMMVPPRRGPSAMFARSSATRPRQPPGMMMTPSNVSLSHQNLAEDQAQQQKQKQARKNVD